MAEFKQKQFRHQKSIVSAMLFIIFFSPAVAQQTAPQNFFQIRFFYPFPLELPQLIAGFVVDAKLKFDFNPVDVNLKISSSGALRQQISLDATASFGFAAIEFSGTPGSVLGARQYGLTAVAQYFIPAPQDPLETQFFSGVGLTYVFQTEDSASGFTFQNLDFSVKGNLAKSWRWNAAYGLSSSLVTGLAPTDPSHSLRADVRGSLGDLSLGIGGTLAIRPVSTDLSLRFDSSLKITDLETLSLNASWSTRPTDDERLTLTTLRLEPTTLSLSVGRSSSSPLSWGLGLEYPVDKMLNLGFDYEGLSGDAPEHDFSVQVSYREKLWNARGSGSISLVFDGVKDTWTSQIRFQINGSYRVAPWSINLRGGVGLRVDRLNANLGGSINFNQGPWSATLELGFNYQTNLTGTASLQVLFALFENLSLNVSASYQRTLTPINTEQFSFGLGLRFGF